jgi:hypothetical protein
MAGRSLSLGRAFGPTRGPAMTMVARNPDVCRQRWLHAGRQNVFRRRHLRGWSLGWASPLTDWRRLTSSFAISMAQP